MSAMNGTEHLGADEPEKLKWFVSACQTGETIEYEKTGWGHVRVVVDDIEFKQDRTATVHFHEV